MIDLYDGMWHGWGSLDNGDCPFEEGTIVDLILEGCEGIYEGMVASDFNWNSMGEMSIVAFKVVDTLEDMVTFPNKPDTLKSHYMMEYA